MYILGSEDGYYTGIVYARMDQIDDKFRGHRQGGGRELDEAEQTQGPFFLHPIDDAVHELTTYTTPAWRYPERRRCVGG